MDGLNYSQTYMANIANIAEILSVDENVECLVKELIDLKPKGRLFIVGVGGSAANASHMAYDLRKLCQIDARSLDNLAEVTARANDEGWATIFNGFLAGINRNDALFVLSVGGGTHNVSRPLVGAIDIAKLAGAKVFGIVGPNGGYTAEHGDCVIKIPCETNPTPYTEAFQAVLWHLIVSHPKLQSVPTKWV